MQLANSGRDRRLGLGLGLAIVKRSAAAMGTTVTLQSVPGRGSCFSIVLPRSTTRDIQPTAPSLPGEQPLQGVNIWVLDDDEALRDALILRLRRWGAQVRPLDSLAALQLALAEVAQASVARPDLPLTDQRMADGSGAVAVRRAREALGAGLPCLLVTGDPDASDSHELVEAGVPLLTKPFAMSALLQALQAALPSRS